MDTVPNWLMKEMKSRSWTQAELARRAGVSRTAIGDVISGKRNMGKDLAQLVAEAFKIPVVEVYRVAGILPPEPTENKIIKQISYLTSDLPEAEQQDILEFVKLRHRLAEERGTYEPKRKKSTSTNN